MSGEELLEEALLRYPKGTIYHGLDASGKLSGYNSAISTHDPIFVDEYINDDLVYTGVGYVYANKKWAKIIGKTDELKLELELKKIQEFIYKD